MGSETQLALDANALIHALKGMGRVRQRLVETDPAHIGVPSVALYELEYGTLRSANPTLRRHELNRVLSVLEILPFDRKAAERAALLRLDLEKRGQRIGPHDLMIAGTALACNCRLVTHNTAEFSRVTGLKIEDWY